MRPRTNECELNDLDLEAVGAGADKFPAIMDAIDSATSRGSGLPGVGAQPTGLRGPVRGGGSAMKNTATIRDR